MNTRNTLQHSTSSVGLADVLERVLDKGIVIAGDIKIKIVDIELLTIQIRLMIASVDKAKEMGMDWWVTNPAFQSPKNTPEGNEMERLKERIEGLELQLANRIQSQVSAPS